MVKFFTIVQITKPTLYSRVEILVNVGDLSVKNSLQTKVPDSNGRSHETTIYSRIETLVNTGDLSVQNFEQTKVPDSRGSMHETIIC